jgi:hypothetical protein
MRVTRKILERVPDGQFSWKPRDQSSTLGKLANHVAACREQLAAWGVLRGRD